LTRIKKLERRLERSQNILREKDTMLNKFRAELGVDAVQASELLIELLNSSRNGNFEEQEALHADIVRQLELQL